MRDFSASLQLNPPKAQSCGLSENVPHTAACLVESAKQGLTLAGECDVILLNRMLVASHAESTPKPAIRHECRKTRTSHAAAPRRASGYIHVTCKPHTRAILSCSMPIGKISKCYIENIGWLSSRLCEHVFIGSPDTVPTFCRSWWSAPERELH